MKIRQNDLRSIETAVQHAEKGTRAEIVPMLVSTSDRYSAAHYRAAILGSIIATVEVYYSSLDFHDPIILIGAQLIGLFIGALVPFIPAVKRFFTTRREMNQEVQEAAMRAFLEHHVHQTRERTGILIYTSLLERRVMIIPDIGIRDRLDPGVWDNMVSDYVNAIRAGEWSRGLVAIIERSGELVSREFPSTSDNPNELPDGLRLS